MPLGSGLGVSLRERGQSPMQQVDKWIEEVVKGKTFADVGGLWGTVNEKVTVALKAGAAVATMIDITPLGSSLWERFQDRCALEGVTNYQCIQGDINNPDAIEDLRSYDVVCCSGVLYHCPHPLYAVIHLAAVCKRTLILGSSAIPSTVSTASGALVSEPGSALFVPALNETQKGIIDEYFKEVGAQEMVGINTSCDWSILDDYAPWWWLFTPEHVAALLEVAGFRILESGSEWEGRTALYLAEKS